MQFLIADTFTDSFTKLNNHEQKAVKTTVFDFQVNPGNPGMQFRLFAEWSSDSFFKNHFSTVLIKTVKGRNIHPSNLYFEYNTTS
jgi:hypothetical protein